MQPLLDRVGDMLATDPSRPAVAVLAQSSPPIRGAWNVQVFHGLGDKGYTLNPLFLQRGRHPRARTALNAPLALLRLPAPFLSVPKDAGRRAGRYEQVNAYGPRFADALEAMLDGTEVSRFGHPALNDRADLTVDADGPVLWLPTWDNRGFFGGPCQSSLEAFGEAVLALADKAPVLVKYHPLTVRHRQAKAIRRRIGRHPNITVAPPEVPAYDLLHGCRGLATDTSSVGFEAYCMGIPVLVLHPTGVAHPGLHGELAQRTPLLPQGAGAAAALARWAEAPERPSDTAWARDLLFAPAARSNDRFAATLRARAAERAAQSA